MFPDKGARFGRPFGAGLLFFVAWFWQTPPGAAETAKVVLSPLEDALEGDEVVYALQGGLTSRQTVVRLEKQQITVREETYLEKELVCVTLYTYPQRLKKKKWTKDPPAAPKTRPGRVKIGTQTYPTTVLEFTEGERKTSIYFCTAVSLTGVALVEVDGRAIMRCLSFKRGRKKGEEEERKTPAPTGKNGQEKTATVPKEKKRPPAEKGAGGPD